MKIVLDLRDNDTRVKMVKAYIKEYFGEDFKVLESGWEGRISYGEQFYCDFWANIEKK